MQAHPDKTDQFICEICGKNLNSEVELKEHKQADHLGEEQTRPHPTTPVPNNSPNPFGSPL